MSVECRVKVTCEQNGVVLMFLFAVIKEVLQNQYNIRQKNHNCLCTQKFSLFLKKLFVFIQIKHLIFLGKI